MSEDDYISDKTYLEDIQNLWTDAFAVPRGPGISQDDLKSSLSGFEPTAASAVLSLHELFRRGALPACHDATPWFGYSLVDDFGDEVDEHFDLDHDPNAVATARAAVGLADNGGGLAYLVVPSGEVRLLDMGGLPHYWQDNGFPSVGVWWWAMFHAHLVQENREDAAEYVAEARRLGCLEALEHCSISIDGIG